MITFQALLIISVAFAAVLLAAVIMAAHKGKL